MDRTLIIYFVVTLAYFCVDCKLTNSLDNSTYTSHVTQKEQFIQHPEFDTTKVDWNSDFMTQMYSILNEIRATKQQVHEADIIENKIKEAIYPVWPDVKIIRFGSVITGLWLKTSDIDIGVVSNLAKESDKSLSVLAAELAKVEDFSEPHTLNVNVKGVSIKYIPTNRKIDVILNRDFVTSETTLINYIMNIDDRAVHITNLIKWWAEVQGLAGHNRLTGLRVYILTIFYLQQEGLLPSVASMLDYSNSLYNTNGWNVALKNTRIPRKIVAITHYELLGGFFEYYEKFNWHENVISVFSGTVHNRREFLKENSDKLPDIFADYKTNVKNNCCAADLLSSPEEKLAYIQGHMYLSDNLGAQFNQEFFKYFKLKLVEAANCYRSSQKNNGKHFLSCILKRK